MPQPARRQPAVPGASSPMVPPRPPTLPPPPPQQPQQEEEPTPAPTPQQAGPLATVPHQQPAPQQSDVSANMFANTGPAAGPAAGPGGGGMTIALDSVMGGGVDPESDRRPDAYRVRRYVIEALDAAWRLQVFRDENGKPLKKQEIADVAIAAMLPKELLDAAYRKLYGRERPTD